MKDIKEVLMPARGPRLCRKSGGERLAPTAHRGQFTLVLVDPKHSLGEAGHIARRHRHAVVVVPDDVLPRAGGGCADHGQASGRSFGDDNTPRLEAARQHKRAMTSEHVGEHTGRCEASIDDPGDVVEKPALVTPAAARQPPR